MNISTRFNIDRLLAPFALKQRGANEANMKGKGRQEGILPAARMAPTTTPPTLDAYRRAVKEARSPSSASGPNRSALMGLYEQALTDAHLASVVQQRRLATLGRPWQLMNAQGTMAPEPAVACFTGPWFGAFLAYAVESVFYGFSLIQLGPVAESGAGYAHCTLVPRNAVLPENGVVVSETGLRIAYDAEPYRNWVIAAGLPTELGLLLQATPLVLAKQLALAGWSRYLEIFGMPFRKAHTNMRDAEQRERMAQMLSQMGSAGWGVFDHDDRVEFVQALAHNSSSSGYEHLARYADEQLSKIIIGQTMTTDTGASLAQAMVHERVGAALTRADAHRVERIVNAELIPRMIAAGMASLQGCTFRFTPDEDALSPELKLELVKALLPYKQIPSAWLEAEFGIQLVE
jgi:hypothetical protein